MQDASGTTESVPLAPWRPFKRYAFCLHFLHIPRWRLHESSNAGRATEIDAPSFMVHVNRSVDLVTQDRTEFLTLRGKPRIRLRPTRGLSDGCLPLNRS